jgi:hypothetical protein
VNCFHLVSGKGFSSCLLFPCVRCRCMPQHYFCGIPCTLHSVLAFARIWILAVLAYACAIPLFALYSYLLFFRFGPRRTGGAAWAAKAFGASAETEWRDRVLRCASPVLPWAAP